MSAKSKPFLISLLVTYAYISILNWIGHAYIISPFIGDAMNAIHGDFMKLRISFIMITWFVIAVGTTYFTVRDLPKGES